MVLHYTTEFHPENLKLSAVSSEKKNLLKGIVEVSETGQLDADQESTTASSDYYSLIITSILLTLGNGLAFLLRFLNIIVAYSLIKLGMLPELGQTIIVKLIQPLFSVAIAYMTMYLMQYPELWVGLVLLIMYVIYKFYKTLKEDRTRRRQVINEDEPINDEMMESESAPLPAEEEVEEASIILGSESDNRRQRGQWLGSIRGSLRNLLGGTSVSHPLEEPLLAASTGENEDRELVVAVIF
jgi:hypothetical protein